MEWKNGNFVISTDRGRIDLDFVFESLSDTYWAAGRTRTQVATSLQNAICFGLYQGEQQVGFARVVTDISVFGYVADVIIAPELRGQGFGKWLMECILSHPDLQTAKLLLETRDAHSLYEKFGFQRVGAMKRQPTRLPSAD